MAPANATPFRRNEAEELSGDAEAEYGIVALPVDAGTLEVRDAKLSGPFDEVLRTEGVYTIQTPVRAPRANAFAERWIRTVRTECLDWTLVLLRRHLERVVQTYTAHYNARRPHRGLSLKTPDPLPARPLADGARVPKARCAGWPHP
jgi:transposase InsO family protein